MCSAAVDLAARVFLRTLPWLLYRYALRIANQAGPRPTADAAPAAEQQIVEYVGRDGNDAPGCDLACTCSRSCGDVCRSPHHSDYACRFSAKLGKIKHNLSNEDQKQLLATLLQVVKGLPDIVRQPRLHIAGLADATNLARSALLGPRAYHIASYTASYLS